MGSSISVKLIWEISKFPILISLVLFALYLLFPVIIYSLVPQGNLQYGPTDDVKPCFSDLCGNTRPLVIYSLLFLELTLFPFLVARKSSQVKATMIEVVIIMLISMFWAWPLILNNLPLVLGFLLLPSLIALALLKFYFKK
ncbi:MAG: hypothetical protein ABII22_02895 [Candidatus Micrarchaeota archaeon]